MVKSKLSERSRLLLLAGEMAGLGALAVIMLVFAASTLDAYLLKKGQGAAVITSAIFDLTNTDRRINSIGELTLSPALSAVAQAKADDMAQKGYFAHVSPEGVSPWYWYKQEGYAFTYAGENLAIDFSDSADVERAWMNSPTHRANILNGKFTEIGVAVAHGTYQGHDTTFVVQEFGTPAHPDKLPETLVATELSTPTTATEIALATTEKGGEGNRAVATNEQPSERASTSSAAIATTENEIVLGSTAEGLVAPKKEGLAALWNVFAASPRTTLRYAYYLFGFLVLIALVIETGVEIRRHHLQHVFLALGLLTLMLVLFFLADSLVFTNPVLPEDTVAMLPL